MNYRREAKRISKLPLDRDALAGVIEHALRNAHDNGSRERTPALCAETRKHRDFCNTTFLSPPNDCNCDAKGAAEPTPREPRKGDVWRWYGDEYELTSFDQHSKTWSAKDLTKATGPGAFTASMLRNATFVRRAASGTPGDAK